MKDDEHYKWYEQDPRTAYHFSQTKLGVGHYGTTFLATNINTKEVVACKAIAKQRPDVRIADVQNECQIMWELREHPNIIALREVWEDRTHLYIFMEPCYGGELFDYIVKKKQFKEKEAAQIARVILEVISYMHSKGIVHRDLKPENFLLKSKQVDIQGEHLRCIDFGLSAQTKPGQTFSEMVGSSYYVAPEVLRKEYTIAVDMWSAGVILYILLSGYPPFWGQTDQEVFGRVLFGNVDLENRSWKSVSKAAKNLVASLLTRDASQRATPSTALQHPWLKEAMESEAVLSSEIVERLTQFTQLTKLRKLLLNAVARHMSRHDIDNLKSIFKSIDADGSGAVSANELREALAKQGHQIKQSTLDSLIRALDVGEDGDIAYEEFIAAAIDRKRVLNVDTLIQMYRSMDEDNDGFISISEIQSALAAVDINTSEEYLLDLVRQEVPNAGNYAEPCINLNQFIVLLQDAPETDKEAVHMVDEVVTNWNMFANMNGFKQLARLVIARYLDPQELQSVRQLFEKLDLDRSGKLRFDEVRQALRQSGYFVADEQLAQIYSCLDVKHTGDIDYEEFLAGALADQTYLSEGTLRTVFDYFDKNSDGMISSQEIQSILTEFHLPAAAATELLRIADEDQNQFVTFDEFKSIMGYSPDKALDSPKSPLNLNFTKAKTEHLRQFLQDMDRLWLGYVPESTSSGG